MKLNNRGFAISSIMYIILIMAVILIVSTLAILNGRKLILDKQKQESLDNIYGNAKIQFSDVCTLASDSSLSGMQIGAKYNCDPGDGQVRTFYVLEDGDNKNTETEEGKVALILDSNLGSTGAWGNSGDTTPTIALANLRNLTSGWTKVKVDMPSYDQIFNVVNHVDYSSEQWLGTYYWTKTLKDSSNAYVAGTLSLSNASITLPYVFYVRPIIIIPKPEKEYTPEACFEFNSSTGAITNYWCGPKIVGYSTTSGPYETGQYVIDNQIYRQYTDKIITDVVIPETIKGVKVTKIGVENAPYPHKNGFGYTEITSVDIPDTVTHIYRYAFSANSLTSVTIPDSVTTIGDYAFSPNQLKKVLIKGKSSRADFISSPEDSPFGWATGYSNDNITWEKSGLIGWNTPERCFTFDSSTGTITKYLCGPKIASFENYTTSIKDNTSLPSGINGYITNVDIPRTINGVAVKSIYGTTPPHSSAFGYSGITSVILPSSLTTIQGYSFYSNSLTSLTIPSNVTTIGSAAFSLNQLQSVIVKGKSSWPSGWTSGTFGWAEGYSDSNITWNG